MRLRLSRHLHLVLLCASVPLVVVSRTAGAEPIFLAKQYNRCATCHYSATGGGLLTPYGRSLSDKELSATGDHAKQDEQASGEAASLFGALGDALGPVQLGVDVRPSYLRLSVPGFDFGRNILMNADLLAAYRAHDWTVYGEVGRRPEGAGGGIYSYEYWAGHQPEKGFGFRAGRFMPAYGVRFADHTAFNRSYLGFDRYDQVLGGEVTYTDERSLVQVSISPGTADAIIDDTGRQSLTITGRVQRDLTPRTTIVASGLFRHASTLQKRSGASGLALGWAPTARLTTWTEIDARMQDGSNARTSYIFVNETSFEATRGVWLKISPQLRTDPTGPFPALLRTVFEVNLLPRTHVNVDLSYYRDRNRRFNFTTNTLLAQIHLYL